MSSGPIQTTSLKQTVEIVSLSQSWLGRFENLGFVAAALTGTALLAHYIGGSNLSPICFKATILIGEIAGSITALLLILGVGSYIVNKKALKNLSLEKFLEALKNEHGSEDLFHYMTKTQRKEVFQSWGENYNDQDAARLKEVIRGSPHVVVSNLMFINPEFLKAALSKCEPEHRKNLKKYISEENKEYRLLDSALEAVLADVNASLEINMGVYIRLTSLFGLPNEAVAIGKELSLWAGAEVTSEDQKAALTRDLENIFTNLRIWFEIESKETPEKAAEILKSRILELQDHFAKVAGTL